MAKIITLNEDTFSTLRVDFLKGDRAKVATHADDILASLRNYHAIFHAYSDQIQKIGKTANFPEVVRTFMSLLGIITTIGVAANTDELTGDYFTSLPDVAAAFLEQARIFDTYVHKYAIMK